MLSVRRNILALSALVVVGSLLGGCGFMHRHFGHKEPEYKKSVETRPLEVPPDLDTPNSSGALIVPPAGAAAAPNTAPNTASGSAAPDLASASSAPPAATIAPGVSIGGAGLRVADTVDNTWARVGLALERSGAATIVSRDEAGHAYAVETTGRGTTKAGWFKRAITLGHARDSVTAKVQLTVRVSADGTGSSVGIEGGSDDASQDAARALLTTLRQRLS